MKKFSFTHILSIFVITSLIVVASCNKKTKTKTVSIENGNSAFEFENALYQQAYNNGDHHTAVVAINRMLILDSTQTHFYDSLSRHYIAIGNANSASYYAEKALTLDPGDVKMLELAGYIYFEGGSFRKSEEKFSKLYQVTKELKYLYQLSQIYGYMGDVKKSTEMTDMILKDAAADDYMVEIATSEGQVQMVKIKAAAYFVKANLQKSPKLILANLSKALSIQSDFEIARKIKDEMELQQKMEETQAMERRLEELRGRR